MTSSINQSSSQLILVTKSFHSCHLCCPRHLADSCAATDGMTTGLSCSILTSVSIDDKLSNRWLMTCHAGCTLRLSTAKAQYTRPCHILVCVLRMQLSLSSCQCMLSPSCHVCSLLMTAVLTDHHICLQGGGMIDGPYKIEIDAQAAAVAMYRHHHPEFQLGCDEPCGYRYVGWMFST